MEILMIGNGFDLEHNLPTRYTDFLQFVTKYNKAYTMAHMIPSKTYEIQDTYLKFIFENPETNVDQALHEYLENNIWITYFQDAYQKHLADKENWIDFECEISEVIQRVDELHHIYMEEDGNFFGSRALHCKEKLPSIFLTQFTYEKGIKNFIPIMLHDLNRLIGALEIYIYDYIDNWVKIEYYNSDIDAIHPDAILSFNYSNTWQRIYGYDRTNVRYSFIHGKAQSTPDSFRMDECIDRNNMVLGIDEYLPDGRKDKEVDFIAFKKYYQRIYKKTGNEYKSWLAGIDKQSKDNGKDGSTLYIFGHSLDVTDGDVLKELIEHEEIKTVIFYKDKARLGQQIVNLVKVLGSEKVIQYVYGSNPIIEFRQQKNRERINKNVFEITSDIVKFGHFYNYKGTELEKMIFKFEKKIEERDLKYFCSQKMVISFYDVLQRYGLGIKYREDLLEIADSLRNTEPMREPVQFQYDEWEYLSYDKSWRCDKLTKRFIELINQNNNKNYRFEDFWMDTNLWDNKMKNYWKIANRSEVIDKERYIKILNDILYMYKFQYENMNDMWIVLIRLSIGRKGINTLKILEELIREAENNWQICNYTYLLRKLEEYYFVNRVHENVSEDANDEI